MRPHRNMTSEQGSHFRAKKIPELDHGQISFHIAHHLKSVLTEQPVKVVGEVVV